jgi:hypothetical protein
MARAMRRLAGVVVLVLLAACGSDGPSSECAEAIDRHDAIVEQMNEIVDWQEATLEEYGAAISDDLPADVKAEWDRRMERWEELEAELEAVDESAGIEPGFNPDC